jgi:ABC-type protease/lipase transport system fused ATPase/permease subunit
VGTLLAVGAITVCVAGALFLATWPLANAVVGEPSKKPRQSVWKFVCVLTALWPIGILLLVVSLLDLAVTHKVFGSNAGDNVTFALLIAVVGTFAYAQLDLLKAQYGRTIAWSLGKALPEHGEKRTQFRVEETLIKAASGKDRRNAISRVLNAKIKAPQPNA